MRTPDYPERLRRNIRAIIESTGRPFYKGLQSVTARQLYRIESGQSSPTLGTLQLIADELGVDLRDMLEE